MVLAIVIITLYVIFGIISSCLFAVCDYKRAVKEEDYNYTRPQFTVMVVVVLFWPMALLMTIFICIAKGAWYIRFIDWLIKTFGDRKGGAT